MTEIGRMEDEEGMIVKLYLMRDESIWTENLGRNGDRISPCTARQDAAPPEVISTGGA
jgi:hypothetical protein